MARIYAKRNSDGKMFEVISFEWAAIRMRESNDAPPFQVTKDVFKTAYTTSADFLTPYSEPDPRIIAEHKSNDLGVFIIDETPSTFNLPTEYRKPAKEN